MIQTYKCADQPACRGGLFSSTFPYCILPPSFKNMFDLPFPLSALSVMSSMSTNCVLPRETTGAGCQGTGKSLFLAGPRTTGRMRRGKHAAMHAGKLRNPVISKPQYVFLSINTNFAFKKQPLSNLIFYRP